MMTLGSGLLINLGADVSWPKIVCFQIILGLGTGPLFQVPMIALQSQLQPKLIPPAMSALGFLKNLGTSCSMVVGTVLIQSRLGSKGGLTHEANGGGSGSQEGASDGSFEAAYVGALQTMWVFYTCVCFLTVLCAFFLKKENIKNKRDARQLPQQTSDEQQQTRPSGDVESATHTDGENTEVRTSESVEEKKVVGEKVVAVADMGQATAASLSEKETDGA